MECFAGIEAYEDAEWDAVLVGDLLRVHHPRPFRFYTPGFKSFETAEIAACARRAWPAISITGSRCSLNCDHCRGRILESMIPATTPEKLWMEAKRCIAEGAEGMLLSGGSNARNEVEFGPYLDTLRRIKEAWPVFRIAAHTGLVDRDMARALAQAGVDVAMLDLIGAGETVEQVYHLRRPAEDFEASLRHLLDAGLAVVPHIVLGLHYGQMLGEWRALEMVVRHRPRALVLVVAMPQHAPARRPFAVPDPTEVGRFLAEARAALPDMPLLLGCARPPGRAKILIDAYAVLAGLDGLAHPSEGSVALARKLSHVVSFSPACCAMAVQAAS